jgi:hypothetical protein
VDTSAVKLKLADANMFQERAICTNRASIFSPPSELVLCSVNLRQCLGERTCLYHVYGEAGYSSEIRRGEKRNALKKKRPPQIKGAREVAGARSKGHIQEIPSI